MEYSRTCTQIRGKGQAMFIECNPERRVIAKEEDVLDLIGICGEHGTGRLMLHRGNFSEDFFDLKTGLAGMVLQKFVNYRIQVAAIIPLEEIGQERFREMVLEANRGSRHFRVFSDRKEAEEWLRNGI